MSADLFTERGSDSPLLVVNADTAIPQAYRQAEMPGRDAVLNFPQPTGNLHPVTGMVGRCFLRVCLLVDVVSTWVKSNQTELGSRQELQSGLTHSGPTA